MKLAHLADLHLGFRRFDRSERGQNVREMDGQRAWAAAVEDVITQKPDVVLLAGDQFDSVRPTNQAIIALFKGLARLREGLPSAPIVMIAGNHDTPRTIDAGVILHLYRALGIHVAVSGVERFRFGELCVTAVPHQALFSAREQRWEPDPEARYNVLMLHGDVEGQRNHLEPGGAYIGPAMFAGFQYVALGHYHVKHAVAANAYYCGALDYVTTNPWAEMADEVKGEVPGKGYLIVDLASEPDLVPLVAFRPIAGARRHVDLGKLDGTGLTGAQLEAAVLERLNGADFKDAVARLVVDNVSASARREMPHDRLRALKGTALNLTVDLRAAARDFAAGVAAAAERKRLPLGELLRAKLSEVELPADVSRKEFVELGVQMFDEVERPGRD